MGHILCGPTVDFAFWQQRAVIDGVRILILERYKEDLYVFMRTYKNYVCIHVKI